MIAAACTDALASHPAAPWLRQERNNLGYLLSGTDTLLDRSGLFLRCNDSRIHLVQHLTLDGSGVDAIHLKRG